MPFNPVNIPPSSSNTPIDTRSEHSNKDAVTGIVQSATIPFKEKVLHLLAQVPLLKSLPAIEAYVKKTRMENQQKLVEFISSLSEIVNEKLVNETTLKAAAEIGELQMKPGMRLTDRNFQLINRRIKDFDGVGDAKNLPRRVQVNIWPYENMNHCGHASITVKNDTNPETYISWWPDRDDFSFWDHFKTLGVSSDRSYQSDGREEISKKAGKKLDNFENMREIRRKSSSLSNEFRAAIDDSIEKVMMRFNPRTAMADGNFSKIDLNEKKDFLRIRIAEALTHAEHNSEKLVDTELAKYMKDVHSRLIDIILDETINLSNSPQEASDDVFFDNVKARVADNNDIRNIENDFVKSVLKQAPYFMPKARQQKDNAQSWTVASEKVFVPLKGTQGEVFALFGLDEQKIYRHWSDVQDRAKNNEIGYRFISRDQNCSGITAGMLVAGGAGELVPFKSSWFADTPNDIHRYALAVQSRVDSLNQQSAQIQQFYQSEQQNPALSLINGQPASEASVATLRDSINQAIATMAPAEKKRFSALKKAAHHMPEESVDQKKLTKAGIALVEALSHLLNNSLPSPQTEAASRALFSAAVMRESLEKMMKNSIANE